MEDASNHLENCNNAKEIAAYKKELAKKKSVTEKKIGQEELQADIQVKVQFAPSCWSKFCLEKANFMELAKKIFCFLTLFQKI